MTVIFRPRAVNAKIPSMAKKDEAFQKISMMLPPGRRDSKQPFSIHINVEVGHRR